MAGPRFAGAKAALR